MAKGLEKKYYQLSADEFNELLDNIRKNPDTIFFLENTDHPYFFLMDQEISKNLLALHHDQWEFDSLFNSFSDFGQRQLIIQFLINEIQSTNNIENIYSTRHDIYYVLNNIAEKREKKLTAIVNAYKILLKNSIGFPEDLSSLRSVYDTLLEGAVDKEDLPDGKYFRKGQVQISDGMKEVHHGLYPEEMINSAMNEYLHICNDKDTDIYLRSLLAHFLLMTIHPFYDGNGRYGRFMLTMKMFYETGSYMSFLVSAAANHKKSRYYKLLGQARSKHMFGSLNQYVLDMTELLHDENKTMIREMKEKKESLEKVSDIYTGYTKSEKKILHTLMEASLLSEFGATNEEIIKYAGISKRTVISAIQKFREKGILEETKIGKQWYHKLIL